MTTPAIKTVVFAPHSDDETLFASGIVLASRAGIVICCPSSGDYGSDIVRASESNKAAIWLRASGVDYWNGVRLADQMRGFDAAKGPDCVWAPHVNASHPDHVAVSKAAAEVFGDRVRYFHTYNAGGKVRDGALAPQPDEWLLRKLRALACYESQINHPRARQFFAWDLNEYVEA